MTQVVSFALLLLAGGGAWANLGAKSDDAVKAIGRVEQRVDKLDAKAEKLEDKVGLVREKQIETDSRILNIERQMTRIDREKR